MAVQDIVFADEKERELFAEFQLGEEVRAFLLKDPVGRYLHGRAKTMVLQAEIDALQVDPDGWRGWLFARRKLRSIRQKAAVGKAFIDFLTDAITNGQNAERELDEDRET